MRIAIVGTGALGGYYGGVLARAGLDVIFLTRGAALDALKRRDLVVRSKLNGDFSVSVHATENLAELGQPDLIVLTIKAYDLEAAARSIQSAVGDSTSVLTMQNGIDHIDRLATIIPRERIVPGVIYISSTVIEPGVIEQVGGSGAVIIGEDRGGMSERIAGLQQTLTAAGWTMEPVDDIWQRLWTKFMTICAMSGVSALTRLTLREIFDTPESRQLYVDVMQEVVAVARAKSAPIPENAAESMMNTLLTMPSLPLRGSMAYDLAAGRRLELETLNGVVVRYGDELGIPTPMNRAIYNALKPFVHGGIQPSQ